MEIQKASIGVNGNRVTMAVPFAKVDRERRIVRGFATLDNVDRQGDRILPEANVRAFEKSRRNLREMHSNIAAGRVVDFQEQEFYDANTGASYRGIYVEAYVSKGAESTWEKVLDGTLSGFSIGGSILDASTEFDKAAGTSVRIIKDYTLDELSLVDNPANPLANVTGFEKNLFTMENVDGHTMVKGMVADTKVENVFYCSVDELAKTSADGSASCSVCSGDMTNIGWVESSADMSTEIGKIVTKFLDSTGSEGGVAKMSDEVTNEEVSTEEVVTTDDVAPEAEADAGTDEVSTDEVEKEETTSDDDVVTSDDTDDDEAEADADEDDDNKDLEKMFDELRDSIKKSIESGREESEKAIERKLEEFSKVYEEKFNALEEDFKGIKKSLEESAEAAEKVSKRLEAVEASTSIKKSVDVSTDKSGASEDAVFKGVFLSDFEG